MTPKNIHCSPSLRPELALLTMLALCCAPAYSAEPQALLASGFSPSVELPADAQDLFLDVRLNAVVTGQLAHFRLHEGKLWASPVTLREIGLYIAADAPPVMAVDTVAGLLVDYDVVRQRLNLQAPVALLDRPTAHLYGQSLLTAAPPEVDAALRGFTLNYNLYGQHSAGQYTLSALQEWRLSGFGPGVWSNTLTSRRTDSDNNRTTHESVRLDSSWFMDFPDSMHSLTVGDSLTGALPWSRSTRIGGIRLNRNFALQPYRVTAPLMLFQGEAALPSTVDLYINGLRQSSQEVQPGQFEISSAPLLNGLGQAQMLITDLSGQQRSVEFSLYGVPRLLQEGMADYSLELGAVRRGYGSESFDYDNDAMLSATWRYGLSNTTTLEAHAEATGDLHLLGGGGNWRLGERGGVLNMALATSSHQGLDGEQVALGYQWNSRFFNASVSSQRRTQDYRDVASLHGGALSRSSEQLFLSTNTRWGNFGLSYVSQEDFEQRSNRFVNLSWFHSMAGAVSLNFSAIMDLDQRSDTTYTLSFMLPLGRKHQMSSSVRQRQGSTQLSTNLSRYTPVDEGGWGWRMEAASGEMDTLRAQAEWLGTYGQWVGGFSKQEGGSTASYAGLDGGLLWTGKRAYAMRKVDEAFTLVSTSGIPGVPVKLENRLIGTTDEKGLLLINRLNAYQRNQLSIDTLQLPANMRVGATMLDVVPERRSGVLAAFELRRVVSAQAVVQDSYGELMQAGSRLYLDGGSGEEHVVIVGHGGYVYLEDPLAGASFRGRTARGDCHGYLPGELSGAEIVMELGVLVCE